MMVKNLGRSWISNNAEHQCDSNDRGRTVVNVRRELIDPFGGHINMIFATY